MLPPHKRLTLAAAAAAVLTALIAHPATAAAPPAAADAVTTVSLSSSATVSWIMLENKNKSILNVPATVPGCIHTDLLAANLIGEPNYGANQHLQQWIAEDDFSYATSPFALPATLLAKRNVDLVLEGIDTISAITFNNQPVLNARNIHRTYHVDVKALVRSTGNSMAANFTGPVPGSLAAAAACGTLCGDANCTCPHAWLGPAPDQMAINGYIRKEQQSFGWDFAPTTGTSGITKEPKLVGYDVALIRDVVITTTPVSSNETGGADRTSGAAGSADKARGWLVSVSVRLWSTHGPATSSTTAKLSADFDGAPSASGTSVTEVAVGVGETVATLTFHVPAAANVERWWPNGYGEQPLYPLTITLTAGGPGTGDTNTSTGTSTGTASEDRRQPSSAVPSQSKVVQVGFRTIEINQPALPEGSGDGHLFQYVVNSKAIYARGSNWVPAQSLQTRVTKQTLQRHFDAFRSAHFNLVRVWGGGLYASDDLMQLADAAGIIIFQDFMFGDSFYPTNDAFLTDVAAEVRDNVWRMGSHASLGVWCGNNEMGSFYPVAAHAYYSKLFFGTVLNNASAVDPHRQQLVSTPSMGNETAAIPYNNNDCKYLGPESVSCTPVELRGDVHYYARGATLSNCWDTTVVPRFRMVTEFGAESWPSFLTMEPYMNPDGSDYSFNASVPVSRQQHPPGQYEITYNVESNWLWPDKHADLTASSYRDELWMTQVAAAECCTHLVEYWRSQTDEFVNTTYPLSPLGWAMLGGNAGVLYWQADDTWPGPSWSQVELGADRYKVGYYAFQRAYQPVLVAGQLNADTDQLAIYFSRSDYGVLASLNATLRLTAVKWSGGAAGPAFELAVTLPGQHRSAKVFTASLASVLSSTGCAARNECVLQIEVLQGESVPVASNKVYLSKLNEVTTMIADPGLAVSNVVQLSSTSSSGDGGGGISSGGGGTFNITVTAKQVPAAVVWLETKVAGRFSDNGMLMLQERGVQVQFYTDDATVTGEQLAATLTVRSLVDAAHGYSSSSSSSSK